MLISLGEVSIQILCPFLNWVIYLSYTISVYIQNSRPLAGNIICKYVPPFYLGSVL